VELNEPTAAHQLALRVPGDPRPQGSLAYKGLRRGKPILVNDSPKTDVWRAIVKHYAARQAAITGTIDAPVVMSAVFTVPSPQRPRWPVPATKPDLSKLVRAVEDGMVDGGLLREDSRIWRYLDVFEQYEDSDHPAGVTIRLWWD
jgi:Holliday junction resolvase RusA-like endonuclease